MPFPCQYRRSFRPISHPKGAADSRGCFTLLEVVIAIAVISFVLVGLIGLLGVALNTNRESANDTTVAAMTWRVIASLRGATNYTQAQNLATNYLFDAQGQSTVASPYYKCAITLSKQVVLAKSMVGVMLVFTWPNVANPPHTNTLYASLPLSED